MSCTEEKLVNSILACVPIAVFSSGSNLRNGVGTTGNGLVATATLPDTNSLALDGVLSAEGADVAGVLLDFHLLHLLTQGGTVSIIEHIGLTITLSRRRIFLWPMYVIE